MLHGPIENYVDDFYGGAPAPHADDQFNALDSSCDDLGIPRKLAKKQRGVRIELLGLVCDTSTMTVSVASWRAARSRCCA
jgi:hypothetical protein